MPGLPAASAAAHGHDDNAAAAAAAALHPPLDMSLPSTQDSERLYERCPLLPLEQTLASRTNGSQFTP